MQVERPRLLSTIRLTRTLFATLGLDVSAYSDVEIADAFFAVCPVVTTDWPSNGDLRRVFEHLRARSGPPPT